MSKDSLAVIGGGVIGLAVARRALLDGLSVRVHRTLGGLGVPPGRRRGGGERSDPGNMGELGGASWVAGGMLTPAQRRLAG